VVNNTFNFVKEISDLNIDQNEKLASSDIEHLYTNISLTKTVDITINKLIQLNML
jgi:hypothetical protein